MTVLDFHFQFLQQDRLYDPKHRKGSLYNKLNYQKYIQQSRKEARENENQNELVEQLEEISLADELSYLLYFKTCIVEKEKDILKIKMEKTITLREKVIKKHETKFLESFPFYFVSPDLVSNNPFPFFHEVCITCSYNFS